jgi:hypothetical protein
VTVPAVGSPGCRGDLGAWLSAPPFIDHAGAASMPPGVQDAPLCPA